MGKYQGYEKYKNSGVEWLGDIPEHWEVKRFKFLLKDGYEGLKIGPFGSQIKSERLSSSGNYKIYGQENVINQDFSLGYRYLEDDIFEELSIYEIKTNDLLITMMGTSGRCYIVSSNIQKGIMDSHLIRLRLSNTYSLIFIRYLIDESEYVSYQIKMLGKGSIMHGLNSSVIKSLELIIPPIGEQEKIARFLDYKTKQIDNLIAKKEALLEKLNEKRTALISHAVTKGLDPTVPMKDSGIEWLGKIPQHWDIRHVKRIADISYGVGGEIDRSLNQGINLLSLPNVTQNGNLLVDEFNFCELSDREKPELILQKGDLLFNWRNGSSSHLGKTAYFDLDGEWTHVSFLLRLRFDMSKFCSKYFQYMLNGLRITGFFMVSKAGVNNTFNLNELSNLKIICPVKLEQQQIANYLDQKTAEIDQQKAKIQKAIELLKEYRTALITNAVTGKIDVRQIPIP